MHEITYVFINGRKKNYLNKSIVAKKNFIMAYHYLKKVEIFKLSNLKLKKIMIKEF